MYYWNLRRMFSTSCKLWFEIFYNSEEKGKKNFQFDSSNRVFGDSPRSKNRCIADNPSHDLRLINVSHPIPTNIRRRMRYCEAASGAISGLNRFQRRNLFFIRGCNVESWRRGEKERRHWCRGMSYDTIVTLISLDDV